LFSCAPAAMRAFTASAESFAAALESRGGREREGGRNKVRRKGER
jgi:hypothetical protein